MATLTGHYFETAHGHLTYDILEAKPSLIWTLAAWIQEEFGLEARHLPVFGLDAVFLDLWKEALRITLGWDNWSGVFVMAYSDDGDAMVRKIGTYLDTRLSEIDS